MPKKIFSIITPVYNREDCIERCIKSVLLQNFFEYEHILINDGSEDGTVKIIESFERENNSIVLISYSDNKGVNYARNRGIERANSEYIIFLDSDDYLMENSLLKIKNYINLNSSFFHFLFLNNDGRNRVFLDQREIYYENWLSGSISGDFAHVVKTEILKEYLFFEKFRKFENLNWLRIYKKIEKQLLIPEYITFVEANRMDSITRESKLNNKNQIINNYDFLIQFIELYSGDFQKYNLLKILNNKIKKAILFGIALQRNRKNLELIKSLKCSTLEKICYYFINQRIFSFFFCQMIKIKSFSNQLRRNFFL
jgi:glycosyltransferase involved in cell wall biosynthesis